MAMQQIGFRILNDIVWRSLRPRLLNLGCRCFTHSTEILLWATKAKKGGKDRHKFNYEIMKAENGGKTNENVWHFSPPFDEESGWKTPNAETRGLDCALPSRNN